MAQNIYDNEEFFDNYSRLARSIDGLDGAPEWPALRAMLPDLRGLKVLDLGCGYGWFCRWAREHGASEVLGIDVSENMLARATASTYDPVITYRKADMENLDLPEESFGLVYSSLALHYVENLTALMTKAHRSLTGGGALVFSVEHPIYTAPSDPNWITNAAGKKAWPLNNYLDEGPRKTDWLTQGVIKQHRTIATYINTMVRQGFRISHLEEWGPTAEHISQHPDWADERHRPPFLLIAARQ
jgi:ubiquinone/menaquinone biosynthesis C-methylase UbiE